jgi:hypothetical protein
MSRNAPAPEIPTRPTVFEVGDHKLVLTKVMERRWTVAVDDHLLDASFDTQADAWEAGVRDARRLDVVGGKA